MKFLGQRFWQAGGGNHIHTQTLSYNCIASFDFRQSDKKGNISALNILEQRTFT